MKIKMYLLMIASVVLAMLGLYNKGRKAGEQAEVIRQQVVINKTRKVSEDVEEAVNSESDVNVLTGLRNKWTRK